MKGKVLSASKTRGERNVMELNLIEVVRVMGVTGMDGWLVVHCMMAVLE